VHTPSTSEEIVNDIRATRPLFIVIAAASLLLAGCAGPAPVATSGPTAPASREDALLAYTQCMRENGVRMDDPDGSGRIVIDEGVQTDPDYETAHAACEEHLTQGQPQGGGGMTAEQRQQMLDFAACMREHGIDMPDPDFSGGGGSIPLGDIDPTDPEVRAASDECRRGLDMPEPGNG
jgi:hypothetical protein